MKFDDLFDRPEPAPIIDLPPHTGNTTPYGAKALQSELEELAQATPGVRNDQLNRSTFNIAQLVAGGQVNETEAVQQLTTTARAIGLDPQEIHATLRSGMRAGSKHPRIPPPLPSNGHVIEVSPSALEIGVRPASAAEGDTSERTSWWPEPLTDRAARAAEEPEPTHLYRDDGKALFYRGKINGFIGESESGKSWIALLAIIQAIQDGQRVLILDFEDSPGSIHRRIIALGGQPRLHLIDYANPDEALGILQRKDLGEALQIKYGVILADGVGAAMAIMGYNINDNNDANLFAKRFLKSLANTGACVITVDHVPKNPDNRGKGGIGAQSKRGMQDGCCLAVELTEPFGKGQSGEVKLTVDKDRNGAVRGICSNGKYAGKAEIISIAETVRITVKAPDLRPAEEREEWYPTGVMEQVSLFLERQDNPVSFNTLTAGVTAQEKTIRQAVQALEKHSYIRLEDGPRKAVLHSSKTPYRDGSPLSPTVARPSLSDGERVSPLSPPTPSPYGGGDRATVTGLSATLETPTVASDSQIPLGHTHCNRCGEQTPDAIIEMTAGYCRLCGRIMNP